MRNLSNELPYDITVEIEKFDLDGKMYRIAARIFVDKSSQKSIVIGAKGEMLKKIGQESRISIEGFFVVKDSKIDFFREHDIDFEKTTIIRRDIYPNGKSRAFINETPVLLNILSEFGSQIMEIYAQHESILLKDENQQFILIDKLINRVERYAKASESNYPKYSLPCGFAFLQVELFFPPFTIDSSN